MTSISVAVFDLASLSVIETSSFRNRQNPVGDEPQESWGTSYSARCTAALNTGVVHHSEQPTSLKPSQVSSKYPKHEDQWLS
jgi:hypothetical protein